MNHFVTTNTGYHALITTLIERNMAIIKSRVVTLSTEGRKLFNVSIVICFPSESLDDWVLIHGKQPSSCWFTYML